MSPFEVSMYVYCATKNICKNNFSGHILVVVRALLIFVTGTRSLKCCTNLEETMTEWLKPLPPPPHSYGCPKRAQLYLHVLSNCFSVTRSDIKSHLAPVI